MNCGLGNLYTLRQHLLAGSMQSDTRFDAVITDLGKGIAALFEQLCNRKFQRAIDATEIFPADRCQFLFARFPVESVSQAEYKKTESDGWTIQDSGFIVTLDQNSGIVYTDDNSDVGPYYAQVRFTYTGGYWFETAEPDDADYPSTQPDGSNALPQDLRLAWLLQCRHVWSLMDKLGQGIVDAPKAQSLLAESELIPEVKATLANYHRMEMV